MGAWWLLGVAAVGCGHIGFDALADGPPAHDGDTDAVAVPIAFVQDATGASMSTPIVTATFTSAQAAGDLNVVAIAFSLSTQIATVSDGSGNSYTLVAGPLDQSLTGPLAVYIAPNIRAAAAGANVVTVTFTSTPASGVDLGIAEYAGVATVNPLDTSAIAMGMSAVCDSGPAATAHAPDLLLGVSLAARIIIAPGAGFTTRFDYSAGTIEDQVASSPGTYSATATQASANGWVMALVALRGQ